ncbi:MAG TPA: helix-turn-helix transcriptional regulator [Candidatus Kapabacteria bacterium]
MLLQKTIARNVRALRLNQGLRQSDVADLTNLPRTYISHLEKGEINITVETIERLAVAFKVNPLILMIEEAFRK